MSVSNRTKATGRNAQGLILLRAGRYEEAIQVFDEAIAIDRDQAAAWLNRADAQERLGRLEAAEADRAEASVARERESQSLAAARTGQAQAETQAASESKVRLVVEYPERLSRWKLFVKWLFVVPLLVGLFFWAILANIATFLAFWAILLAGSCPSSLFSFISGYLDYQVKVLSYFPLLLVDQWTPGETHPVALEIGEAAELSRLQLVFLKLPSWLFGIAAMLAGLVLLFLVLMAVPVWWVILATGRYPRSWHRFTVSGLELAYKILAWQYLIVDA